jgi:hypothetical protein
MLSFVKSERNAPKFANNCYPSEIIEGERHILHGRIRLECPEGFTFITIVALFWGITFSFLSLFITDNIKGRCGNRRFLL